MPRLRALALVLTVLPATACIVVDDDAEGDTDASGPASATSSGSSGTSSTTKAGPEDSSESGDSSGAGDTSGADDTTESGASNEDFFEFTVEGADLDRTVARSFSTQEAWGNVERVTVEDQEVQRLYLAFPFGSGNIALNLIASEPGTFALPQDIVVYPDILDVSFIEGSELMSFRSTNVSLTLTTLEYGFDPDAKTHAGVPVDGYANVEGTFWGTFEEVKANPGDTSAKLEIEASGSFRSLENL